jgi:hypothetical protein
MASNTIATAARSIARSIFFPTNDQLKRTYGAIVKRAIEAGTLKAVKPPAGRSRAPHWDITPAGQLGSRQEVYEIRGMLYLKSSVVRPGAKAKWFKVGAAPMF